MSTVSALSAQVGAPSVRWLVLLLAGLFFFSGACGLVYQGLWLRMLSQVFGVTTWAASTVLGVFMAGLALGSFGAGRLADRVHSPLLWFGIAELLVGASAFASRFALGQAERLYIWIAPSVPDELGPLTLVRFVLTLIVLLVPTTLMGATLPLVVRSTLFHDGDLGQRVSLLYAANTAGAIGGTLLAGYVLIGGYGLDFSFKLGASVNIIIGLLAMILSQWSGARSRLQNQVGFPTEAAVPPQQVSAHVQRAVLIVFALSGVASLALEVIWFRILTLYLESTTYAFTIMLATVLAGIAFGSLAVAPVIGKRWPWPYVLAVLELLIGISAVLSLTALALAHDVVAFLTPLVASQGRSAVERIVPPVVTFLAIFPTTFLLGAAFPIGLKLWTRDSAGEGTGERIGTFYSLNVFGAILGSMTAGFLLLPLLGARHSLIAVAGLALASGLLLLATLPRGRVSGAIAGTGMLLFAIACLTTPEPAESAISRRYPGDRLLWREDGIQATVSIHETQGGGRRMFLDGMSQASDDLSTLGVHRIIGHLPMAIHPSPIRALVVGLGGGVTPGAVAQHAGVSVDVVELSSSVIHGADWFSHVNSDVLRQPNVRFRIDDGRNFLLLTSNKYDVITADIIRPYTAGAGNLYSREYFELARNALADGGLMMQWVAGLPESQHKAIMRTFLSVFPDATLWSPTLLVGSTKPLRLDQREFDRKLADPSTRAALESIGAADFASLLKLYVAGPAEIRSYVGSGPQLTDDRPLVEYFLSLPPGDGRTDLGRVRGDVMRHVVR
ncbi:MAG: fused MFS/spermidine synthase [Chloroflexota bacterium]